MSCPVHCDDCGEFIGEVGLNGDPDRLSCPDCDYQRRDLSRRERASMLAMMDVVVSHSQVVRPEDVVGMLVIGADGLLDMGRSEHESAVGV